MNKRIVIALAAVGAMIVGLYVGSPYYAVRNLQNAALAGDVDALEAGVDFPSVQSSLKSQMTAAVTTRLQNDPQMRDNPFAGLGMAMLPAIIDKAVTSYVTPDGIAALVKGRKPGAGGEADVNPDVDYRTEWSGMDRFRVHTTRKSTGQEGPTFVFERRGLLSWTMVKVELPTAFLDQE